MVTSGQRASIEDLIMSIIAGAQVSIGAAKEAIDKAGGTRAALSQAKEKVLASAIIQGPKKSVEFLRKMTKSIAGTFGIQFSIASILKQSQIFTGALGTVFQILGAFVDVILAPFMPIFVRLVKRMVSWIPTIQEKAEAAAAWLEQAWFTEEGVVGNFLVKAIIKGIQSVQWGKIANSMFMNQFGRAGAAGAAGYAVGGPPGAAIAVAGSFTADALSRRLADLQETASRNSQNETFVEASIMNISRGNLYAPLH